VDSLPSGLAEQVEIEAYTDFATGTTGSARDVLGIATQRFGSARALAVRNDSSNFWTKSGGFDSPVTLDELAAVCDFFRGQEAEEALIAIAPDMLPADWAAIRDRLGLRAAVQHVKLTADVDVVLAGRDGVAALDPRLRVQRVEPRDAVAWATVMMETFEMADEGMVDMAASAIGRPNWQSFAVWDGDQIVSVGSWFQHEGCANMFGGATAPAARGRGAQSALLTTRARAAQAAGCRWLVAETEADEPGGHNSSLHNLLRAGFERLYERTDWAWRPTD
jgi:ribosomal protein S18 acetylase RimI-like enzyme